MIVALFPCAEQIRGEFPLAACKLNTGILAAAHSANLKPTCQQANSASLGTNPISQFNSIRGNAIRTNETKIQLNSIY